MDDTKTITGTTETFMKHLQIIHGNSAKVFLGGGPDLKGFFLYLPSADEFGIEIHFEEEVGGGLIIYKAKWLIMDITVFGILPLQTELLSEQEMVMKMKGPSPFFVILRNHDNSGICAYSKHRLQFLQFFKSLFIQKLCGFESN